MKALYCRAFGPETDLTVEEIAAPVPAVGEVLVLVQAAGLNFPDLLCVRGEYQFKPPLPFVPGSEGAGVVTALGADVTGVSVDDRVCFNASSGAFAEEIAIPASAVTQIPDSMPFEQAAGLTVVYGTSYYALKQRAGLQSGETLLVLGAAGGVGLSAVELGAAMGARVIAAASSDQKLAVAAEHGAEVGINYATEDLKNRIKEITEGAGANVIYDPVGGELAEAAFRGIAWEGRHLVIGFASGPIPKLPLNLPLLKGAAVVGVFWGSWTKREPEAHEQNMAELFELFTEGTIQPHVSSTYSLDQFLDAFGEVSGRRAIGKVILTP
ncbi:MAG: NADPH:quinone oxidoreductase family protein [Gammaproteobacteria bacterium]|nr:MAG: NADPH:quinone oxidoreductase family protein [Gammaproteobacteria bacterium]